MDVNQSATIKVFYVLLSAAVRNEQPYLDSDLYIDWCQVLNLATRQNVLGLLWISISKLPKASRPPRQLFIGWGLSAQEIEDNYHLQKQVLFDIVGKCYDNNVKLLVFKGLSLSYLYYSPQYRSSCDIDIFLFGDHNLGDSILGAQVVKSIGKHSTLLLHGIEIENHSNFLEPNTPQKRKIINFINTQLPYAKMVLDGYYTLPPLANCVFLLFHALKHFESGNFIPVKNILDFALFFKQNQHLLKSGELMNTLSSLRLERAFEFMIILSSELFGISFDQIMLSKLSARDRKLIRGSVGDYSLLMGENVGVYLKRPSKIARFIPENVPFNIRMIQLGAYLVNRISGKK